MIRTGSPEAVNGGSTRVTSMETTSATLVKVRT